MKIRSEFVIDTRLKIRCGKIVTENTAIQSLFRTFSFGKKWNLTSLNTENNSDTKKQQFPHWNVLEK